MNWPRNSTKRALSTVIVSAMLLSAVAVMGVFLVGWANSSFSQNQVQLDATFSSKVNKLSEEIAVEHVWFGTDLSANKFVNVTLSNISDLGLTISKIEFVQGTTTTDVSFTNGDVLPGKAFSIKKQYTWTSGTPFNVVVTTARGNIFTTQVLPQ